MKMKKTKFNKKSFFSIAVILMISTTSMLTIFLMAHDMTIDISKNLDGDLNSSSTTYISGPLGESSDWWDSSYGYRKGFKVQEDDGIGYVEGIYRYQPVDVYFPNFGTNEHYQQTTRLIRFNATGNDEWSDPIPIEVWNETLNGQYIESCTITFIANVTANTNSTYFLYYNDDMTGITAPSYSTGMSIENFPTADGKRITVTVDPPSGSEPYEVIFESGADSGVYQLQMGGYDFHMTDSLRPEKIKEEMKLLLHFEEADKAVDSSDNEPDGVFGESEDSDPHSLGSPTQDVGGGPDGSDCLFFDKSENDTVTWNDGSGYDGLTWFDEKCENFTIMGWIKPTSLDDDRSNHNTENCFLSKAGDSGNDNLEIGIEHDGASTGLNYIHLYIDQYSGGVSTQRWFGNSTASIIEGEWNFFAVTYLQGDVKVYIYNDQGSSWFDKSNSVSTGGHNDDPWEAATGTYMDQATNAFAIGCTHHGPDTTTWRDPDWNNVYYEGYIDEVSMYSIALGQDEVESYKSSVVESTIESITTNVAGTNNVMAKFTVDWVTTFDMHVSDVFTFYYDYNLYNIHRSIWFDTEFRYEDDTMTAIYGYYNLSGDDIDEGNYYFDGKEESNMAASNEAQDYLVMVDTSTPWNAVGLFMGNYTFSRPSFMSCDRLKGSITSSTSPTSHYLKFEHGSNNTFENSDGGSDDILYIDYWEYADRLTGSLQTSSTDRIDYFNNISESLQNPLETFFIYDSDNKFYGIEVNVTDIDANPVPYANVTIYNATDGSYRESQLTDANGLTTFTRMPADTYKLNVTYLESGYIDQTPLQITTAKTVTLNDNTVGAGNINKTKFENVLLTSLNVTCQRSESAVWKELMNGAQITYSIHNRTDQSQVLIGTISANENGTAIIRYYPLVTTGNISFTVKYGGTPQGTINTTWSIDHRIDLDYLPTDIKTNITLSFYEADAVYVNVSSTTTIETALEVPYGTYITTIGNQVAFDVNFTYNTGGGWNHINGGTVSYVIVETETQTQVSAGTQTFTENGDPYSLTLDTSNYIPGTTSSFQADVAYEIQITASFPSYPSKKDTKSFRLTGLSSSLSGPVSGAVNAYWGEDVFIRIHYQDIHSGLPYSGIEGATITYVVNGYENSINNTIRDFDEETNGWYNLTLETGESGFFPSQGSYTIKITSYLQGFLEKEILLTISILPVNTKLNGYTVQYWSITSNVYSGDKEVYTYNYTVAATGKGINDTSFAKSYWIKFDDNNQIEESSYALNITRMGNGIYILDFDTETRQVGSYVIYFTISGTNYAERTFAISLTISKRIFSTSAANIYPVVSGNALTITLSITDTGTGQIVDDIPSGSAYVTFLGTNFLFVYDSSEGVYVAEITNIPGDVFLMPTPLSAQIVISRDNYTTANIPITINVGMIEIFPGMPMFYFLMLVGAITAVAVSLVTYRTVQRRRIPTFVKKTVAARKAIESKGKLGESLIYPPKDEFTVKLLGEKWEALGLSLGDILGIEGKKGKATPGSGMKNEDIKGGGM